MYATWSKKKTLYKLTRGNNDSTRKITWKGCWLYVDVTTPVRLTTKHRM